MGVLGTTTMKTKDVQPQRAARIRAGMSLAEADALTGIGIARLSVLERLPPARLTAGVRRRLSAAYQIREHQLVCGASARPAPETADELAESDRRGLPRPVGRAPTNRRSPGTAPSVTLPKDP